MLIEVDQYEPAAAVAHRLLREDDSNVELWYLLGYCLDGMQDYFEAKEVLTKAGEMFQQLRDFHRKDGVEFPYAEQETMVLGLLQKVTQKYEEQGDGDAAMEEGGGGAAEEGAIYTAQPMAMPEPPSIFQDIEQMEQQ